MKERKEKKAFTEYQHVKKLKYKAWATSIWLNQREREREREGGRERKNNENRKEG
jgi:hypothetical protein